MLKNYLKIAFRNMWKRKVFTSIHIIGLSVAFAAAILLFLTAMFELSYNDFHQNSDRLGLVYDEYETANGKEQSTTMPIPFAPTLKAEIPLIEKISRYGDANLELRNGDKQFSPPARFVDPDFLEMFSISFLTGSAKEALAGVDNIVLTLNMSNNLFGDEEVIGKTVEVNINGHWESKIVSAIIEDLPKNSSLEFNALIRFEKFPFYQDNIDRWNNANHEVYVLWKSTLNPSAFNRQVRSFTDKHYANTIEGLKKEGATPDKNGAYFRLQVLPLTDQHFSSLGDGVNPFYPWMLLLLSVLIIFIACSNFINLSFAGSLSRSKEIGMRKTLGGQKWQLIMQLWSESALICISALFLGLLVAWLLVPAYNAIMGYALSIASLFTFKHMLFLGLVFFIISAVAGGYPAWMMANFNTIQTLKGNLKIGGSVALRPTLTVLQFAIAILLISGTLVISRQLNYLQTRPLGYNKTEVISIPIGQVTDPEMALQRMRTALTNLPEVISVSGTDINMGRGHDGSQSTSQLGFDYEGRNIKTHWQRVDFDYLQTLAIDLVEGRDFSREYRTDSTALVINEEMAKQLGENVVGKVLPLGGGQRLEEIGGMKIIGIAKNYHFKNLYQKVAPLTLYINPKEAPVEYIFVKVRPENLSAALTTVEKIWKDINPKATAAASFLDENTHNEYRKEQRFSRIITSGASLAIIIACMGLFAIALLTINQRVKEIGVRKVLGAKVSGLLLLLCKDFVKMVVIGFVISAPIAWWASRKWLDGFAYRIEVNLWVLLFAGFMVLIIALATVLVQALQAALANPVDSLRDE